MMRDCGNQFEAFISKFHIKYERLQIEGYHHGSFNKLGGANGSVMTSSPVFHGPGQIYKGARTSNSVPPYQRNAAIFSVHHR